MVTAEATNEPQDEWENDVDQIIDDWFDKYDRWQYKSQEVEQLKKEIKDYFKP